MIIGLTVDDLLAMVNEDGKVYLNREEPDNRPLPAHIVILLGDTEEAIAERIERTLMGGDDAEE